jgi:hypothetical protein
MSVTSRPSAPAVERVVNALEAAECRPRRSGQGWHSLCPAHEDVSPSLSIAEGDDARALVHCFAGCTFEAVMVALGLGSGDLFDRPRREPAPRSPRTPSAAALLPGVDALRGYEQRLHSSTTAQELPGVRRAGHRARLWGWTSGGTGSDLRCLSETSAVSW